MNSQKLARALFGVGLAALCALALLTSLKLVGDFQIDDAYITFAFSKNVALGRGAIYGYDLKVEGYSNFLWMLLISLGLKLGAGALTTARALAHIANLTLLFSTYKAARSFTRAIPGALSVACLAATSDLVRAAQSGLETCLYSALIATALWAYVSENAGRRHWSMVALLLAALTRIDGFVPLFAVAGFEAIRQISSARSLSLSYLRWLAIGIVPLAIYWLWRYSYYGLPLPLPFYAKATQTIGGASSGLGYLWNGVQDLGLWVPLLLAALGVPRPLHQRAAVLLGFLVLGFSYVAYVGGDWMPMERMFLPLLSPLWVLASLGLEVLWERLSRRGLAQWVCRGTALLLCVLASRYAHEGTVDTSNEKAKIAHAAELSVHTRRLLDALPFLQAMLRKPGERLVTDYGGVFAFGTDASVIEMWGLCNREIALHGTSQGINPIYGKTCVPCYAEFDPDYFHLVVPLLRSPAAIPNQRRAISEVFQGNAIDRYVHFKDRYRLGRVTSRRTKESFFFLEKRRTGLSYEPRSKGDYRINYIQDKLESSPSSPERN